MPDTTQDEMLRARRNVAKAAGILLAALLGLPLKAGKLAAQPAGRVCCRVCGQPADGEANCFCCTDTTWNGRPNAGGRAPDERDEEQEPGTTSWDSPVVNWSDQRVSRRRVFNPVCFLRGTKIRTLTGFCNVEDLAADDLLPTLFRVIQPIARIRCLRYELPVDAVGLAA